MAVAIQAVMPRPPTHPVPIASAKPQIARHPSDKENILPFKSIGLGSITNIRSRRERPCDACRRRKSRCVIHEGAVLCVLCEFHKQECTFVQDPQPRKRKVVVVDESDKKDTSPKKRSLEAASTTQKATTKIASKPVSHSVRRPINTHIQNHVLGETLGLQSTQHSRYIGLTTPFDPIIIGLSSFNSRNESAFSLGTLRRVNNNETFLLMADEGLQNHSEDAEALDAIEQIVGPHGPALIDLYFDIVHPSLPVIQKPLFLQRVRAGDPNFAPALLAGIYILALNWWAQDPKLASQEKPDTTGLDAIAMKSLNAAMQRPKLSTVQAGLLLLQRPEADSWSLTTQLVAVGQELGLHLDCSSWSIPVWERQLRKKIAWALFMQDKWSSLIHGRPSHIFSANWAVPHLSLADETDGEQDQVGLGAMPESQESKAKLAQGHVIFTQMIALTSLMAELMDTFYTQVALADFANAGNHATRLILERAKPIQIKLKDWYSTLPAAVRMESVVPKQLTSTGFLHLAYFATEITLHRKIVQSLNFDTSEPYLMHVCRSAAKTRLISAMDFVNRLKPEQLQGFWYFPSRINFTLIGTFGALLWATAPAREEAEFYKARLREYRWTLSVSSRRAEFLGFAVQMLDTSRTMLNNLAEKPSLADRISNAGVPAPEVARVMITGSPSLTAGLTESHQSLQHQADQGMDVDGDMSVSPSLTRNTSVSAFSGFSDVVDRDPGITPPSSVGG